MYRRRTNIKYVGGDDEDKFYVTQQTPSPTCEHELELFIGSSNYAWQVCIKCKGELGPFKSVSEFDYSSNETCVNCERSIHGHRDLELKELNWGWFCQTCYAYYFEIQQELPPELQQWECPKCRMRHVPGPCMVRIVFKNPQVNS